MLLHATIYIFASLHLIFFKLTTRSQTILIWVSEMLCDSKEYFSA